MSSTQAKPMHNQIIAESTDKVTWGASGITIFSAMIDFLHVHFGWLFSTGGLALMSVLIGVISAIIGLIYRKRDAKFAANREAREAAIFEAQMLKDHGPDWRVLIGWEPK